MKNIYGKIFVIFSLSCFSGVCNADITNTIDAEKARYQYIALSRDQLDESDWYGYNPITPWRPTQVGSFFRGFANAITRIPFDVVSALNSDPQTKRAVQDAYTRSLEMHPGEYYLNIPERKEGFMLGSGIASTLGLIGFGDATIDKNSSKRFQKNSVFR